ncbi:ABC transporter permease [Mesoterricola silvestris]|uniref:ABC transporter permease n=1 Tax=Mesoterricola silvestris TaxID=2927979 RepID=A0AA48KB75_9BACT|nr:ABC transporter permease [Mesoterricola silvestris]BDU74047.1 ABC transporter permease [Mesoterricola silvestris]
MWLKFEQRPEPSRLMRYLSPLLAVGLMVASGMLLFHLLGKSPVEGFKVFFLNPIQDKYGVAELFLKATPLILCAVGLSVGFRGNIWNIGAEGQLLIGALAGGGLALHFHDSSSLLLLPAMIIAGALGGMFWAAIPAWLRTRFNANEILTSLMLVYIAELIVSWLVHGPWMDPDGFNFPQTRLFQAKATMPILVAGTRLNAGLLIAVGALIAGWIFMNRSFMGYQMKVAGQAENAGRYAGFSARRTVWIGMLVGGAMAGIAGVAEIAGPVGQITEHISPGYGFAAMIVAFVGRLDPVGIFFSGLLMALLYLGGEQAQQYLALPYSISKVFQGLLLFFLLCSDVFITHRIRWKK